MAIKEHYSFKEIIFKILIYIFFAVFTLLCVFPFYYIFINSISNNQAVETGRVLFYPIGIHFNNYVSIFEIKTLPPAALVSLERTILGTIISVVSASFMGYCMSKQEYWHRKFFYRFIIATMYFGAGVIPVYLTYRLIGLLNSFWVYVLPSFAQSFNMVLCKTYIESIPTSLEESAEIDGAGYLQRYFRIILPLAKPILATIAIFAAVGQWNAFMDTVLYINKTKLFTLQYTLNLYLRQANALANLLKSDSSLAAELDTSKLLNPTAVRMTITMVTVLPILLVYPFFQKYFVKGIMIGAVKG